MADARAASGTREGPPEPWRLSALSDGELEADIARVGLFNDWHGGRDETPRVRIDAFEAKAGSRETIAGLGKPLSGSLRVFFEIPLERDTDELLSAIARADAAAKVRTGGAGLDSVPDARVLVRFFDACLRHGVGFKATGGLHRPLFGVRSREGGEKNRRRRATHGFLNVLLSAAFMYDGMDAEDAAAVVTEPSADAFPFGDVGVEWRGHRLASETLSIVRRDFALSFGCSSFEEPIAGLSELDLR
jgi:hypothetical protein